MLIPLLQKGMAVGSRNSAWHGQWRTASPQYWSYMIKFQPISACLFIPQRVHADIKEKHLCITGSLCHLMTSSLAQTCMGSVLQVHGQININLFSRQRAFYTYNAQTHPGNVTSQLINVLIHQQIKLYSDITLVPRGLNFTSHLGCPKGAPRKWHRNNESAACLSLEYTPNVVPFIKHLDDKIVAQYLYQKHLVSIPKMTIYW